MTNPIADAFNDATQGVIASNNRTLQGFLDLACHSSEFQATLRQAMGIAADSAASGVPMSTWVFQVCAMCAWMGFESGKLYVMNHHVDVMLALEDQWDRKQNEQP